MGIGCFSADGARQQGFITPISWHVGSPRGGASDAETEVSQQEDKNVGISTLG